LWVPNEFLDLVPIRRSRRSRSRWAASLTAPPAPAGSPTEPALILGGGPIGLLFLAYAELSGASPIVVSEPNPDRAAVALDMGADHIVDPLQPNAMTTLNAWADGHGFPIVVDTLGTLLETALHAAAKGAEIWVFGVNHKN
jgi:threonine dehydrogenase-like Zn-dependent dehydrogenase